MRICAEILYDSGHPGLHIKSISEQCGIEASKLGQFLTAATVMHMASTYAFSLAHIPWLLAADIILDRFREEHPRVARVPS